MSSTQRPSRLHSPMESAIRLLSRIRRRPYHGIDSRVQGTRISPRFDASSEECDNHTRPTRREPTLQCGPFWREPGDVTHTYPWNPLEDHRPFSDDAYPSVSTRVPLEVQEHIIGFLGSGSMSALSAALICRSWYPSPARGRSLAYVRSNTLPKVLSRSHNQDDYP